MMISESVLYYTILFIITFIVVLKYPTLSIALFLTDGIIFTAYYNLLNIYHTPILFILAGLILIACIRIFLSGNLNKIKIDINIILIFILGISLLIYGNT